MNFICDLPSKTDRAASSKISILDSTAPEELTGGRLPIKNAAKQRSLVSMQKCTWANTSWLAKQVPRWKTIEMVTVTPTILRSCSFTNPQAVKSLGRNVNPDVIEVGRLEDMN